MSEQNEAVKSNLKINVEPMEFKGVADVVITTTTEFSKVINDIFSQTFADYYGCKLEVGFNANICNYVITPILQFKVLPKEVYADTNKFFAFMPLNAKANTEDDILGRIQRISKAAATSGIKVDITDDGKSVLSDFVLPNVIKSGNFKWNEVFTPGVDNDGTYIRVFKLDIRPFLKKIYGENLVDANGNEVTKYFYQITPTCKLNQYIQYKQVDNWAINILRLDKRNMDKGLSDLGYMVPSGQEFGSVVTAKTTDR